MSINLSKKFTPHVHVVTGSVDVIVTQLLRYHMLLLYCMQPFNDIKIHLPSQEQRNVCNVSTRCIAYDKWLQLSYR